LEAIEMAEDREKFRDLLDRIGQPYAPSWIIEGETDEERDRAAHEALTKMRSRRCWRSSPARSG
ncbi:MAG: hypothetical protein ABSE70_02115, partial [Candidatus Limnocylindrales bacterium]